MRVCAFAVALVRTAEPGNDVDVDGGPFAVAAAIAVVPGEVTLMTL
jgi:hypothetical protein